MNLFRNITNVPPNDYSLYNKPVGAQKKIQTYSLRFVNDIHEYHRVKAKRWRGGKAQSILNHSTIEGDWPASRSG
jgi:hypothetical protein